MRVPEDFVAYLEEALGGPGAAVALEALGSPASVSVRLNPFKTAAPGRMPAWADGLRERVPWSRHGFMLESRPVFTLDPCFHAGAYYVQDSSSMFVGEAFRKMIAQKFPDGAPDGRPVRVLDLCAAPGGKTTDLAASLREMFGGRFVLVANEVVRQRAAALADNLAVWGDPNVMTLSADPAVFAQLGGHFDAIVADVPCSGEGMFRKDGSAAEQWSRETVELCRMRQRRIVADVWPALAEGGIMIYSTCTFNRLENDLNVGWIMEELGACTPADAGYVPVRPSAGAGVPDGDGVIASEFGHCLVRGFVRGEGQYCAAIVKTAPAEESRVAFRPAGAAAAERGRPSKGRGAGRGSGSGSVPEGLFVPGTELRERGGRLVALPCGAAAEMESVASVLHPFRAGCIAGEMKGGDFVPSADLALSLLLGAEAFPRAELSEREALAFLHRDTICLSDAPKGYVLVCYASLPLGFVKNIGPRCNNLHPQGRRIRMDINRQI